VSWYRLPSQRQRLTWSWPTFLAVLRGAPLKSELRLCVEQREGDWGPSELKAPPRYAIFAENKGNLDWTWARPLKVSLSRGKLSDPEPWGELQVSVEGGSLLLSARTQRPFEHLSSRAQLAMRLKAGGSPQLIAEVSLAQGEVPQWSAQVLSPRSQVGEAGGEASNKEHERVEVVPCEAFGAQ
jgi:hypothetical protein